MQAVRLTANQPSSSSRRVGAGKGAPGDSCVGNRTPPPPNGLYEDIFDRIGVEELVVAGRSDSRLDHPNELILSRNEVEAIVTSQSSS